LLASHPHHYHQSRNKPLLQQQQHQKPVSAQLVKTTSYHYQLQYHTSKKEKMTSLFFTSNWLYLLSYLLFKFFSLVYALPFKILASLHFWPLSHHLFFFFTLRHSLLNILSPLLRFPPTRFSIFLSSPELVCVLNYVFIQWYCLRF